MKDFADKLEFRREVYLKHAEAEELGRLATQRGLTISKLLRQLVLRFLQEHE